MTQHSQLKQKSKPKGMFLILLLLIFTLILSWLVAGMYIGSDTNEDDEQEDKILVSEEQKINSRSHVLRNILEQGSLRDDSCRFDEGGNVDTDDDEIVDSCDNCPEYFNPFQEDSDLDGKGDVCDFSTLEREKDDDDDFTCFADNECGTDGFVGGTFCSVKGDSVRLFADFSCNNPGKQNSFCSSVVSEELVEICDNGCENGSCVEGEIACFADNECGIDGFAGNPFCYDNDVLQVFADFSCDNPGTDDSGCSLTTQDVFINSCEFSCVSGLCARCDEDLDCDDNDANTQDICILPETILSFCVNSPILGGECAPGDMRACGFSDVGQCSLGTQTCQSDETWGLCVGAIFPTTEICDGFDNDCDGNVDEELVCAPLVTQCNDEADNDGDGFTDLNDPGCESSDDDSEDPFHYPQCDDGFDNDLDGKADFPADPQCTSRFDNNEAVI